MSKAGWLGIGLAIAAMVPPAGAQKIDVSVLYRQNSDTSYRAVIPGYSTSDADESGSCALDPNPANCPAPNHTAGSAPGDVSYTLVGTTLSLLLPDGRVAVVNCVNRYSEKGNYINRRSCAMPMVEHLEAEFTGQSAKLKWLVGAGGRKTESETYKVVALLEKR
jgi:hypothetical protein